MGDAIALSSPSGRMSKRARKEAETRLARALYDSIHQLARSGAMLLDRAPGLGVERVADILDALMHPERYDVIDGKVTRKVMHKAARAK